MLSLVPDLRPSRKNVDVARRMIVEISLRADREHLSECFSPIKINDE